MPVNYEVHLKNHDGDIVARISDFVSMVITHKKNDAGTLQLQLPRNHPAIDLFAVDFMIDVRRRNAELGLDWYTEKEAFHRTSVRQTYDSGRETFTSYSQGYLHLLERRNILWPKGNQFSSLVGAADWILYQVANSNIGPQATAVSGRSRDGVMPGMSIEIPPRSAAPWQGARQWKNCLSVCQEIALESGLAFDIVGTGPATFEFRSYQGQRGLDRTTTGIDPATGRNAAGNLPAVFSLYHGNMGEPSFSSRRTSEKTVAVVIGAGISSDQTYVVVESDAANDSPWNDIEVVRQGADQGTGELTSMANQALEENKMIEHFFFTPIQIESSYYGRDYWFGDKVTARYQDIERNKEIIGVTISVSSSGTVHREDVSITLGDNA